MKLDEKDVNSNVLFNLKNAKKKKKRKGCNCSKIFFMKVYIQTFYINYNKNK